MRLTIYRKFLLVLIPVFAAMAGVGLLILSRIDTQVSSEALAMRLGAVRERTETDDRGAYHIYRHPSAGSLK